MPTIAATISAHGFGHAARACAVMEAAFALDPTVEFQIFTTVPEWFFRDSLSGPYVHHETEVDVGLAQRSALREDLPETTRRLAAFMGTLEERASGLALRIRETGCAGVLSDISPLGILAGERLGLPVVLLESFLWPEVYRAFAPEAPELLEHATALEALYGRAHRTLRTDPATARDSDPASENPGGTLHLPPVARPARVDPSHTRRALGVPDGMPLVLLTLGGVGGDLEFRDLLAQRRDAFFCIPMGEDWAFGSNTLVLPTRSGYYHPDLMAAADAVVGKLGYSTLAEAYLGRTRYAWVARPRFAETAALEGFLKPRNQGVALEAEGFRTGAWLDRLDEILALPRPPAPDPASGGAPRAAEILLGALDGSGV